MIRHTNLQPRPAVRKGVAHQARTADDYHADVEPGESIRIWGRRCVGSRRPRRRTAAARSPPTAGKPVTSAGNASGTLRPRAARPSVPTPKPGGKKT